MATDPWAAFNPQPAPSAPAGVGRPVIRRAPEPTKPPSGYRDDGKGGYVPIKGGPGDPYRPGGELDPNKSKDDPSFKPTEFQSKSAGFLGRMVRANDAWSKISDNDKGPRGIVRQWFHDNHPDIENTFLNEGDRQAADQNVNDFIAASLRQESGAAISQGEFDRQFRIFFPMPGDGPEVLKQKADARRQAIEGFRVAAGPLGESVLAGMSKDKPADENKGAVPGAKTDVLPDAPLGSPSPDEMKFGADGRSNIQKDGAEVARQFEARIARGDSPEQLSAWFQSIGREPLDQGRIDAINKARSEGKGLKVNPIEAQLTPKEQAEVDRRSDVGGLKAASAGAADALTFGSANKIIAAGRDLAGKEDYDRGLLIANAVSDKIRGEHFLPYVAGSVAGGAVYPTFGANSLGQLGKLGALYGGAYGVGSSDNLSQVPENLLTGAATGYGFGAGVPALAKIRLAGRANPEGREVYNAAERLGMTDKSGAAIVMPADVGGTFTRKLTSAAAQGPISAIPVVSGANRVTGAAQGARDRIAAGAGQALEPEAAGQGAARGAASFIKRTSQRGDQLYRRAEALAGDAKVPLPEAIAVLDRHIAELSEVPGGGDGLEALKNLRSQLSGEFSVKGIRGMRTQLRDKFVKDGLRGSDLERRVNEVVNAAADDIANGLAAQGKGNAAGVYKVADRYWRARLDTIDSVLQPIIGRQGEKSGEEVMASINRAAKGNNERLVGLLKALPNEEAANVRATLISQLGKVPAGRQGAAGEDFSLSDFLTHWNTLSPGAKRTLFQGETRAALDDLAKVAEGSKAAQRHGNFSNTAGGLTGQAIISGLSLWAGGLPGAIASGLSQYGAGRLLASPRFARWLVGATKTTNPTAHIGQLSKIAAKEAGIASDLTGLQQRLLAAVNDNPITLPAVASQPEEGRND